MAEHRENGRRSRGDDPLSGCYLLIVVGEPTTPEHREVILQKITKGFLSWDMEATGCCISAELQYLVDQDPIPDEAKNGEKLIQFVSENLVTEVLIHPQVNTLQQCMKNLLSSYTKHKHVIHSGYAFSGSGSWILQDSTYSFADFLDAFQDAEVQRIFKAYENCISIHVHCAPEGDWTTMQLNKEPFSKLVKVAINPDDKLSKLNGVANFVSFLQRYIVAQPLVDLLEPSDVVGNIRFSRPTLYVFPGGQGDSALFGVNGFNMLIDGGFNRKACFWDFARHLDRVDALLVTQISNSNLNGVSSFLKRKVLGQVYPKIGHVFCNVMERKHSPDGDKDTDSLLVSLAEEGHLMMENLRHLGLKPQNCYRESSIEAINLYHKVGHGNLDMFVLNPAKDSKEVKEFLQQWHSQSSAFGASRIGMKIADKELLFPLPNLMSICAILVWQPADPTDSITRILFPGSSPQTKIFEGLDKLRHLDILKAPVCSEQSLQPTTITKLKSKSQVGDIKPIRLSAAKLAAVNKSEEKQENIPKMHHPKTERKYEQKVKSEEKKVAEVKQPMPKVDEKKLETKAVPKLEARKQETKKSSSPMIAPPEKKPEPKKVVQMVGGKLIEMPAKTTNGASKGGAPVRHPPADNGGKSAPKAKGVKEATNKKAVEEKNIATRASATAKKEAVKKTATKKPSPGSVKRPSAGLATSKTLPGTASPTPSLDLENKKVSSSSATSVASSVDTNVLDNKAEAPVLIDEISPSNEVIEGDGHMAAQDSAEEEKTSMDEKQSLDEEVQAEKDSIKLAKEEFLIEETTKKEEETASDEMRLEDRESDTVLNLSPSERADLDADSTIGKTVSTADEGILETTKRDIQSKETMEPKPEDVERKSIVVEKEEALIETENLIDEISQHEKDVPTAELATREDEKHEKFEVDDQLPEVVSKELQIERVEGATPQTRDSGGLPSIGIGLPPAAQMPETDLQESHIEKLDFQEKEVMASEETPDESLVTLERTTDETGAIDKDDLQGQELPRDTHAKDSQQTVKSVKEPDVKEHDIKIEKYVEGITQSAIKEIVREPEDLEMKVKEDPDAKKSLVEEHPDKVSKDDIDFHAQEVQETHEDIKKEEKIPKGSEYVSPMSKSPEMKDLQLESDFDFASMHPTESWQKQHIDSRDRPREDAGETFLDPSKVHIIFTAASSEETTDEFRPDDRGLIEQARSDHDSKDDTKDNKDAEPHHAQEHTDVAELEKTVENEEKQFVSESKFAPDLIAEIPASETVRGVQESALSTEPSPVSLPSQEAKVDTSEVKQEKTKDEDMDGHFEEKLKEVRHEETKDEAVHGHSEDKLKEMVFKEPIVESTTKVVEEHPPPSSPVEKYVDHGRIPIAEETGSKVAGLTDKDLKAAVILSPIPEDAPKLNNLGEGAAAVASGDVQRETRPLQESQECLRTPDEVADLPIHEEVPTEFEGYYQIRGPLHGIPETLAEHDDIPPHLRSAILASQMPEKTLEKEPEKPMEDKMEESVYLGTLNADHAEVVTLSNGTSPSSPLSPKSPKDKETKEVENIFIHPSSSGTGKVSSDEGITHFKEVEESPVLAEKLDHPAGLETKKEKVIDSFLHEEVALQQAAELDQKNEDHHTVLAKRTDDRMTKYESQLDRDASSKESQIEDVGFKDAKDAKESKLEDAKDVKVNKLEDVKDVKESKLEEAKDVKESKSEDSKDVKESKLEDVEESVNLERFSSANKQETSLSTMQSDVAVAKEFAQEKQESHIERTDFRNYQDSAHTYYPDQDITETRFDQADFRTDQDIDHAKDELRDRFQESPIYKSNYATDHPFEQPADSAKDRPEIPFGKSDFELDQEIIHDLDVVDKREHQVVYKSDREIYHGKSFVMDVELKDHVDQSGFESDQEIDDAAYALPEKRGSQTEQTIFRAEPECLHFKADKEIARALDDEPGKQESKREDSDLQAENEKHHAGLVQDEPKNQIEKSDLKNETYAEFLEHGHQEITSATDYISDKAKHFVQEEDFRDDQGFMSLEVAQERASSRSDSRVSGEFESSSPVPHEFDHRSSSPILEGMRFQKAPVDPMAQSFYDETTAATHEDPMKNMDPMTQSFYDETTATRGDESPGAEDEHGGYFVLPVESHIPSSSPESGDFMKNIKAEQNSHEDSGLIADISGQLHDAKAMDDFASTHTKHEEKHQEGAMGSAAPPDIIDVDIKPKIESSGADRGGALPKEQESKLQDFPKDGHAKDSALAAMAGQVDATAPVYDAAKEYEGYYEVHVPSEYGIVAPGASDKQPSSFGVVPEKSVVQAQAPGLDILSDIEPKRSAGKSEHTVQEEAAAQEPPKETAVLSLKESISLDEKDKEELVDEYQSSSPYYHDSYSPETGFEEDSPVPPLQGQQSPTSFSPDLGEGNNCGRQRSETFVGDPYDDHQAPPNNAAQEFPQSAFFSDKYDARGPHVYGEDDPDEDGVRPSNEPSRMLPDAGLSPMHSGSYVSADEDTEDEFRGQQQSDADSESPYHRPDLQAHLLREKVAFHDPIGTDSSDDSDADVVRKRHVHVGRAGLPEHQPRRVDVHVQGGDAAVAGKFGGGGLGHYWEQEGAYELASEEHKRRGSPLAATGDAAPEQYTEEADTWDPSRGLATQDFDPRGGTPDYAAYHPTAYQPGPSSSDSEPPTSPELSPKGFEMDSPEVRHTPFKFCKQRFGEEKHYREGPESPFPASGGASLSSPSTEDRSVQEDKKGKPASKNPFDDWEEPMGLPSPTPPVEDPEKTKNKSAAERKSRPGGKAAEPKRQQLGSSSLKKNLPKVNGKSEDGENKKEEKSGKKQQQPPPTASPKRVPHMAKSSPAKSKRPESPLSIGEVGRKSAAAAAANRSSGLPPVYVDLTYIPHHGNPFYCDVEFFRTIRARYYVFSGTNPSKEVFNALLEAKQGWENPDLEVTIIPTYDTDTLGYWFALNEDELAKNKIDLAPSASRCTINLQDHETSCSAYRLEF